MSGTRTKFGGAGLIGVMVAVGTAAAAAGADGLLSDEQRTRCAAGFADRLRAWNVVVASDSGVDLAAPVVVMRRDLVQRGPRLRSDALLRAMRLRMGAKVRFIRRDSQDPAFLPGSDRFDYETRLRIAGADAGSDHPLRLLLEVYAPAAAAPALWMEFPFSPSAGGFSVRQRRVASEAPGQGPEGDRRRPADDDGERRSSVRPQDPRPKKQGRGDMESREAEDAFGRNARRSVRLDAGEVFFMDEKTAARLVVTEAVDRPLDDGRLEVRITFVSRKDDQDVEIRTVFYDGAGRRVEKHKKREYEFEENHPRTIVARSTRPAANFRMTVEDD